MRILAWCFAPPTPQSGYIRWLKDGLEALGHQVIVLDIRALASQYGPTGMQRIILQYARAYAVDVALVLPTNFVEPALLQALRRMGVVLVGFRYDDAIYVAPGKRIPPLGHLRTLTQLDSACDLVVTICRRAVSLFAELGLPVPHYLPFPYPWQLVSAEPAPQQPVIRFSGSSRHAEDKPDSWRVQVVRALIEADLPIELCHDSWADVPGCEAYARPTPDLPQFFDGLRTATVNLCLPSDYSPEPTPGVRQLHLETAAAGGMLLTQPCPELADYFVIDQDYVGAFTLDDYVRKCRHFLADPEAARRIGQNGRRAVERTGGWDLWWNQVVALLADRGVTLNLDSPPRPPAPDAVPVLSLVASSLAHAHEAAGDRETATAYFEEVLSYDSTDYGGLTGLARLAADPEEARPLWLRAFDSMEHTQTLWSPPLFGSQAFAGHTNFAYEAATQCLQIDLETGRYDEIITILGRLVPCNGEIAYTVATHLLERRQAAHCMQALELSITHWPEVTKALRLRARIHRHYGRLAEAHADDARATAMDHQSARRA